MGASFYGRRGDGGEGPATDAATATAVAAANETTDSVHDTVEVHSRWRIQN